MKFVIKPGLDLTGEADILNLSLTIPYEVNSRIFKAK